MAIITLRKNQLTALLYNTGKTAAPERSPVKANRKTVEGHYPYASPGVAQTVVVSSQEGSEGGQLSARGFEPTHTPTPGLQITTS